MPTHETRLVSTRFALAGLRVHSALVFFFLIAPIIAIVPLSFNSGSYFSYPMDGFSLRWYAQAFGSQNWQHAFANSIGIGAAATLISTGLGTLAALGLARADFPLRGLVMPLLISPMIIPIVVVAAGFYLVFAPLGLVDSYAGVVLAHAALGTPFVVITVTASLLSFDRSLLRAAAGLGASQWTVFRRVTLPLILPAVATGSIFAFATSFDEVIVILFIGGPAQQTVPRRMWSGIRDQIDPSILAVATVLIVFAVALFSSINWLRSRAQAASAAIDA
ncbi:ABC transporter permease [Paraburkholderia caballeronis]|uniref:ABC transporter permease n=1 Tax=Paraburkholderia caballeronis TaxID=416943 RepID=UPI00106564AC|nr:ABC transporter permease [Paraburkholderia caballeronis]TDV15040.1 putative spermidine/putrescine transport system permease protein [Paraburkholderia caballeronis]TDV16835.1 putative spermidine/putrescine transport system permease protein [Paraburkholderia caballeronis]TDV25776.1 putative spermidine/putrescine transport system permease protein [Paraburkholderia caballeronis]